MRRLLRCVVLGVAKREQPETWSEQHLANLLSPEALTAAAEDLVDEVAQAMVVAKEALGQPR